MRKAHLIRQLPAIAALSLLVSSVTPARGATDPDLQLWLQLIAQTQLDGNAGAFLELQPRFSENGSELSRLLVRPAVNYQLNPSSSLWLGYLWMPQYDGARGVERRPWVGVQDRRDFGRFKLASRARLEHRLIPNVADPVWRLRTQLQLARNIRDRLSWVISEEVFFQFNSSQGSAVTGFEQQRLFLGIQQELGSGVSIQPGYLLVYLNSPGSSPDRLFHSIMVGVSLSR